MSEPGQTGATRVLLSFSSAYADLARRIASDLSAANIDVRYDQWRGGGGVPATQSVATDVGEVKFVLPLLTPSDAAATWIGDEWKSVIHDAAGAHGVEVLPLRGDGELSAIPEFLRDRSFADLRGSSYTFELRRLIETIRTRSGDSGIRLPDGGRGATAGADVVNPLALELGDALVPLFASEGGSRFADEAIPLMYDGLFYELGVAFPEIRILARADVPSTSARIVINDVPETVFVVRPGWMLVAERVGTLLEKGFVAEPAVNPASGADCAWIPASQASAAGNSGLTTWDEENFLILTLCSVLRRKAADFIGIDQARAMLELIQPVFPLLVAETVPKTVPLFVLTDVLRRLVAELVSIRNLHRILMALAEWGRIERDPLMLTEYARGALRREITHQLSRGTKHLIVLLLDPEIEATIAGSMRYTATGTYLELEPSRLRKILDAIREPMDLLPNDVMLPQILTTMEIRSSVRRLVAPSMPRLHVVSYQELRPDTDIQPIGRVSLDGFNPRHGVTAGGLPVWRSSPS